MNVWTSTELPSNGSSSPTNSRPDCHEAFAYLADQLRRAATSVPLNIAEGAREYSAGDKARFYRMARRSATESAAILDVCRETKLGGAELVSGVRVLLLRVVAMLTAMVLRLGSPESGLGSGSNL